MSALLSKEKAYQQKLEAQLDQIKSEISKRRAEIEEMVADQKIAASTRLDELEQQLNLAQDTRDNLNSAPESAWNDLKVKSQKVMTRLQNGLKQLAKEFDLEPVNEEESDIESVI